MEYRAVEVCVASHGTLATRYVKWLLIGGGLMVDIVLVSVGIRLLLQPSPNPEYCVAVLSAAVPALRALGAGT